MPPTSKTKYLYIDELLEYTDIAGTVDTTNVEFKFVSYDDAFDKTDLSENTTDIGFVYPIRYEPGEQGNEEFEQFPFFRNSSSSINYSDDYFHTDKIQQFIQELDGYIIASPKNLNIYFMTYMIGTAKVHEIPEKMLSNTYTFNNLNIYYPTIGASSPFILDAGYDKSKTPLSGSFDGSGTFFNQSGSNNINNWNYMLQSSTDSLTSSTYSISMFKDNIIDNNGNSDNLRIIHDGPEFYAHKKIKSIDISLNYTISAGNASTFEYTITPLAHKSLNIDDFGMKKKYDSQSNGDYKISNTSVETVTDTFDNTEKSIQLNFPDFLYTSGIYIMVYSFKNSGTAVSNSKIDISECFINNVTYYDNSYNMILEQTYNLFLASSTKTNNLNFYIKSLNFFKTSSDDLLPNSDNYQLLTNANKFTLTKSIIQYNKERQDYLSSNKDEFIYANYVNKLLQTDNRSYIIKNIYFFGNLGFDTTGIKFLSYYKDDFQLVNNWDRTYDNGVLNNKIENCTLEYSIFENFGLFAGDVKDTSFDNSSFKACRFIECDFSGVSFENVQFEDVRIKTDSLYNCITGPIVYTIDTQNPTPHAMNKILYNTNDPVVLSKHNNHRYMIAPHVNLSRKDIRETDFITKNLSSSNLSYAQLSRSYFENVDFSGANLQGADLTKSTFKSGVNLLNVKLENAQLENCTLEENEYGPFDGCGNLVDYAVPEVITTNGTYGFCLMDFSGNSGSGTRYTEFNEPNGDMEADWFVANTLAIADPSGNNPKIHSDCSLNRVYDLAASVGIQPGTAGRTVMFLLKLEEHIHQHAETHGDPHIFPVYGTPYELPSSLSVYRMLQGNNVIINASTRKITQQEGVDILDFFERVSGKLPPEDIVSDGYFYDKVFIESEGNMFMYNFQEETVEYDSTTKYFKTYENKNIQNKKLEPIKKEFTLKFNNSVYGTIKLSFKYYINPQTKYGFDLDISTSTNNREMSGLFIREYLCNTMEVPSLYYTSMKKGTIGKNKILSSRKRIPQVRKGR